MAENKYNNFLVHVPHASIIFPSSFKTKNKYSYRELITEAIFEADYMVDLFIPEDGNVLRFPYSRMFCDVERYKDDKKEEMSKYGMGFSYIKDSYGRIFNNGKNKANILKKYYDIHHKKLDIISTELIKKYNYCYIVDLHSYSDEFVYKLFKKENNPDICIGYEEKYMQKELLIETVKYFKKCGYSVSVNKPYSGSIIPNKYYGVDNKICSIMIEINKRIYLDYNLVLNIEKYLKLKECMDKYYVYLNKYIIKKQK